jgi:tetratricopeptide (TPR) repeat protein
MDRQPSTGSVFRQAFLLDQQGKITEAEQLYRIVLDADPDSAETHHNLGTLLVRLNRLEEAITHFEKALAIRPDSMESRNNLANVLARLNRLDQSIVEFEKALDVSRRAAEPYLRTCYNIAVTLQALDRHEEAITHYCYQARLRRSASRARRCAYEKQARGGGFSTLRKICFNSPRLGGGGKQTRRHSVRSQP